MKIHAHVFTAKTIFLEGSPITKGQTLDSHLATCAFNLRNRSIMSPPSRALLAIGLDFSSISEELCTSCVVLDALDRFIKLPCLAIW